MNVTSMGRCREYFKNISNPVTIMAPDTQEVQLREDNTLHAAEMFPTVKTIKAAGCDEI